MITVVAAAFTVGGVAGIILLHAGHHAPRADAVRNPGESVRLTHPPGQEGSAPAPDPSSAGHVTVTADAAQDANASSVAAFLDRYFTAINTHNYQSYISLLNPQAQQGLTPEQFDHGYRSTTDSAETLVRISAATNGDLAVAVTFTSHQDPADSPNRQQSCTDWNISLFLEQDGGGYLIDQPPPGYSASDNACS